MKKQILWTALLSIGFAGALAAEDKNPAGFAEQKIRIDLQKTVDHNTKVLRVVSDTGQDDKIPVLYPIKNTHAQHLFKVLGYLVYSGGDVHTSPSASPKIPNNGFMVPLTANDGKSFLLISVAQHQHEGIRQTIEAMDKPEMVTSSGSPKRFYWPKYRDALDLEQIYDRTITNISNLPVGASHLVDSDLNMIGFDGPPEQHKLGEALFKQVDMPEPSISVTARIYEVSDTEALKIGFDWVNWKNTVGRNLFNLGLYSKDAWTWQYGKGRDYLSGPSTTSNGVDVPPANVTTTWFGNNGENHLTKNVSDFNFSCATSFFDLLAGTGKAKIQVSPRVSVLTGKKGTIRSVEGVSYGLIGDGATAKSDPFKHTVADYTDIGGDQTGDVKGQNGTGNDQAWRATDNTLTITVAASQGTYANYMAAKSGDTISVDLNGDGIYETISTVNGDVWRIKGGTSAKIRLAGGAHNVTMSGNTTGTVTAFTGDTNTEYPVLWEPSFTVYVGNAAVKYSASYLYTRVGPRTSYGGKMETYYERTGGLTINQMNLSGSTGWGVVLNVSPTVGTQSTLLKVDGTAKLLTGFASNGSPLTQEHSINTTLTVGNETPGFVIGAYDRVQEIKSSYSVPLLGQIPGLNWLFGNETNIVVRSKVVIALDVKVSNSATGDDLSKLSPTDDDQKKAMQPIDRIISNKAVAPSMRPGVDLLFLEQD